MIGRNQQLVLVCLIVALFASHQLLASPPRSAGDIEVDKKSFLTKVGQKVDYELGMLFVPENSSEPTSRLIGVGFARFRATEQSPTCPPVFRLPGGPGSSYLTRLKSGNQSQLQGVVDELARFRCFSDVVFVDQRGFSEHGDVLQVPLRSPPRNPDQPQTLEAIVSVFKSFALETVAEFADSEIDLRGYTVKECAHDVADLRRALGYDKIILDGTSFGSQWSFAVMRLHPNIVARALLSGVEPLNHGYDMPSYIFAAVQRMWRAIDQDARFQSYLPKGGMAEAARVAIERLEREPLRIESTDPKSGEKKTHGVLGADRLSLARPNANPRALSRPHKPVVADFRHGEWWADSENSTHRPANRFQPWGNRRTTLSVVNRSRNAVLGTWQLCPLSGDGRHLAQCRRG